MHNRDEVIRQSAIAANNHAYGVRAALKAALSRDTPDAELMLRDALVALDAGFDGAHDGSTYAARREAARLALAAWDGAR